MAIKLINKGGSIPELLGLSTDTKPAVNTPLGTTFTEEDTGKQFKFGVTGWFPLVVQTSIVGSLAKEIPVFTALAIVNTNNYEAIVDVSNIASQKAIMIRSTLDQSVTLLTFGYSYDGTTIINAGLGSSKTLTANTGAVYTASDITGLAGAIPKIKIRLSCVVAPLSGSVSVNIVGV